MSIFAGKSLGREGGEVPLDGVDVAGVDAADGVTGLDAAAEGELRIERDEDIGFFEVRRDLADLRERVL